MVIKRTFVSRKFWATVSRFENILYEIKSGVFVRFLNEHLNLQVKVVDYKEQCQTMENRLLEVNLLANQSQLQLNDTTNVIQSLEERLKTTEVNHAVFIRFSLSSFGFVFLVQCNGMHAYILVNTLAM